MKKEYIMMAALTVFTAGYFWSARTLPDPQWDLLGPRFFPMVLVSLLAMLLIWDAVNRFRARAAVNREDTLTFTTLFGNYNATVSWVLVFLYIPCLWFTGFIPATIGYLFLQIFALSERKISQAVVSAVIAVGATGAVYVIFEKGLSAQLP